MAEKFIQAMHLKKGALHKDLHVPLSKNIPQQKLHKAEHSRNPKIAKRARTAEMLEGLHH